MRRLALLTLALAAVLNLGSVAQAAPSAPRPAPSPVPQPTPSPAPQPSPTPTGPNPSPAPASGDETCWFSVSCYVREATGSLFAPPESMVDAAFLHWLLRMPDLEGSDPGIRSAAAVTRAAAWALLGGLVTFAVFSYWATGLTSRGGGGGFVDAIVRCGGAATFILGWPWLYENGMALADTLTFALVSDVTLQPGTGPLTPLLGIVVSLLLVVVMIGLYLAKIGLAVGLCIAYLALPIAAALWVVPATAHPLGYAARYCAAAMSTQVMWAICLVVFGALNRSALMMSGSDAWTGGLQNVLLTIAVLGAMLAMPRHMFRAWGAGGEGGGMGRAAGAVLHGFALNALASQIPDRFGGRKDTLARGRMQRRQPVGMRRPARGGGPDAPAQEMSAGAAFDAAEPAGGGASASATTRPPETGEHGSRTPAGGSASGQRPARDGQERRGPSRSGAPAGSTDHRGRRQPGDRRAAAAGVKAAGGAQAPRQRGSTPPRSTAPPATPRGTGGVSPQALARALDTAARGGYGGEVQAVIAARGASGNWEDVAGTLGRAAGARRLEPEMRDALGTIAAGAATPELRGQLTSWTPPAAVAPTPTPAEPTPASEASPTGDGAVGGDQP